MLSMKPATFLSPTLHPPPPNVTSSCGYRSRHLLTTRALALFNLFPFSFYCFSFQ
jgi:hypothetical protein